MRQHYFFVASVLLLGLSLIAFSDNLITDVRQESNADPKFVIHGLFMLAWMVILVIQTGFIKRFNYAAHEKLGIASVVVAAGVVVSTFYVFVSMYQGWDKMPSYVRTNRLFMASFAVLFVAAFLNRKRAEIHKRLMFMGTLYLLEPILSRVNGKIADVDPLIFLVVVWNAFFASLFIYDWVTLKRIHPVTYLGFLWFYAVWIIALVT
jgi:hypothetical protein